MSGKSKTGPKRKGDAHLLLEQHLRELGIKFFDEWRFHPDRRWRFDYVFFPDGEFVAIEIEGIVWRGPGGRHQRGAGMEGDLEKYATAMSMGWNVWRFSPGQIKRGEAKAYLEKWKELRGLL